jgi:hypothetical protein
MSGREMMTGWVLEALRELGGRAPILEVCKHVWRHHEADIRAAGDLMFEWQYEIRWAGDLLRREGALRPADLAQRGIWELA